MNINDLFVSAGTLPLAKHKSLIGKLAINERNVPGVLVNIDNIDGTHIFIGFDLAKGESWVSLNPSIMMTPISMRAAMEWFYTLRDIRKDTLKSKVGISISPPMSSDDVLKDLENATWNKLVVNEGTPPEAIQDFLNKLFNPNSPPSDNFYTDIDFKIDNEDEDPDNI